MGKINFDELLKTFKCTLSRRSPEILMRVGLVGTVATVALAVKATPKALALIDEAENEKEADLTNREKVKACWKCYVPTVITGVGSVACLIASGSINIKRNAALATAYAISDSAFKEYREKVVETVGEKKEKMVRDTVTKEKMDKNPVSNADVIVTEKGDALCYDSVFGRYFKSDRDTIRRAEIKLNRQIISEMCASVNEFYDELGLSHIKIGDDLGWDIDDGQIVFDYSSQLADDGTPCLVISYRVGPLGYK